MGVCVVLSTPHSRLTMATNDVAGRAFAAASSVYERGRPDYPTAVVAALNRHLKIDAGTR